MGGRQLGCCGSREFDVFIMAASQRTIMPFLLPLFLATCFFPGSAGFSINTPKINKKPYELGENFTLNIRVDDPSDISFINILKKPIVVKTRLWNHEYDVKITNNGALIEQLQDTGRYTYTETRTPELFRGTLSITGLTIEDVGFYGIAAANSKLFNYTPLQVYVPVKSVQFYDGRGSRKIDSVTVRHGSGGSGDSDTDDDLHCTVYVEGTTISPDVSFWIGQGENRINVTDRFRRESRFASESSSHALSKLSSNTEYSMRPFIKFRYFIKPEHHDKKLFCEATMVDKHYPIKSANVTLNVEFQPVLKCPGSWMFSEGQKNATVTCFIFANPKVDLATLSWYSPADTDKGLSNITVLHGETEGGVTLENKVINSTFDETKLLFSEIKHGRYFTITARSDLGNLSESIYVSVESEAGTLALHTLVLVFTSILALSAQWN